MNRVTEQSISPEAAVVQLKTRANKGDLHAIGQLGVWYLLGHQVSRDIDRGFTTIKQAAEGGEIASQTLLASLYAAGMGVEEDWELAYSWLVVAASNGDPKAIKQVTYFLPELVSGNANMTWQDIRNRLDLIRDDAVPDYTVHHTSPLIRTQESFLDDRTCDYVMEVARPYLHRAQVNDSVSGVLEHQSRTNSVMSFFSMENDLVIQKVNKKIANFLNIPVNFGEPLSVLKYEPGQEYVDHYDYFNPEFPSHVPLMKQGGQRVKTFLVYLNDDFTNGETAFPKLDWQVRGKRGEAVVFDNVEPDGTLIENSLHAGRPPSSGEKWIISKWLRDKPQY